MSVNFLKKKHCLINTAFVLIVLSHQSSYGIDRPLHNLPETPLGFYKSSPYCQCGSLETRKAIPERHSINLSHPPKNQGPLGTCVSFAASACCEFYYPGVKFSEAEFTVLAETDPPEDCIAGLFLGKALSTASRMGFVEESRLPYETYLRYVATQNGIDIRLKDWKDELREKATEEVNICIRANYNETMRKMRVPLQLTGDKTVDCTSFRFAKLYAIHHVSKDSLQTALSYRGNIVSPFSRMRISSSINSNASSQPLGSIGAPLAADIESVKKALYCGLPVATAINVYGNWDNPAQGIIDMPATEEIDGDDSHAIVLTGFDNSTKLFRFRNSWGEEWGDSGFGALPYNYLKLYSTELVAIAR